MRAKVVTVVILIILIASSNVTLNIAIAGESNKPKSSNEFSSEKLDKTSASNKAGGWNFNDTSEWGEFAYVSGNLTRLILGVNEYSSSDYTKLRNAIIRHQGRIVNTVSINGAIKALTIEIPLEAASSFAAEATETKLAKYVEPNIKFRCQLVPNDPYWGQQWGPKKIEADWAWNTTVGNSSILVAVVDTGINYLHSDLAANYVARGYDWVNNDTHPMDDNGHGTHCAGIIAAKLNNSIGIAGLAQVRIMAEKGLNAQGEGYSDWLANGIIHAVGKGADIISMSWGGYYQSELIYDAIKYAYDSGVLLVAAAGNEGTSAKLFPAGYDEVTAVTATDSHDDVAPWSNYGDWVELSAPGVDIYSTYLGNSYVYLSGTSMATPHVAGVAALIWSRFPNKTRDWVRMQLRYAADDLGQLGFDVLYGYGRINARKAVEQAPPIHDLTIYQWKTPPYVEPGSLATINATILNFGAQNETNVTVQLLANHIVVNSTVISFIASSASATISVGWNPTIEGKYNVALYLVPVTGETVVQNNDVYKYIYAGFPRKAVVLHSEGNILSLTTRNWDELNVNWQLFGSVMIYVDYTTLNKDNITYEDIAATHADVLIISSAWDPESGWEFTDSEIAAIKQYVLDGHGIIATEASFYYLVPNNNKLASLFGLNGAITCNYTTTSSLNLLEPDHPLFSRIPNPYNFPEVTTGVPLDGNWDANELAGGKYIALQSAKKSAIVVYKRGRVYISPYLESIELYDSSHLQLLYNAITWSPQELSVSLDAPPYLYLSESELLNATAYNIGATNETNVMLQLLINGTVVSSTVIAELTSNSSYTLNYLWTPEEGTYNITAYVTPVDGETYKANNTMSKIVRVSQNRDVALLHISAPSAVYVGRVVNITVLAGNIGELSETFNVTAYYDFTPIDTLTVTNLAPGQNITLTFHWNTTGLQPCHMHTIWANATGIQGELNTENNVCIDGQVKIKMQGDVNGDGKVNIYDVVLVTSIYGCHEGDPEWNPEVDLAPQWGVINIYDIVMITSVYGETC